MEAVGGRWARCVVVVLLLATACGGMTEAGDGSPRAGPTGSPSATAVPTIELRIDGLGVAGFGGSIDEVLPVLIESLGPPVEQDRAHGWMPFGYGGEDTTVRWADFGGLYVAFCDWPYFRDDGVMHLMAWGASGPRTANGSHLMTPEGITVGSSVVDLEAAYGDSLRSPEEPDACTGAWRFGIGPPARGSYGGTLTEAPWKPGARVASLYGGALASC